MNPKISIIVPVYNVEPYIHKCLDSILAQTFTDFELILVNDGSSDQCGDICDQYAIKDKRIIVIHKRNGGQASARNQGLNIAKGEYIGFVDSDDWIESDMFELLYNMCIKYQSDISVCTCKIHDKNKTITQGSYSLTVQNRNEAMKSMLEGKLYDEVVWSKLFKRNLFENIRFTEGILYEDTALMYKIIHKSKKVCCVGEPKYQYIKHDNSTMSLAKKSKRIDAVVIYNEMNKFIAQYYQELTDIILFKLADIAFKVLNTIACSEEFSDYIHDYYKVSYILNCHFHKTIKLPYFNKKMKLLLVAVKIHPLFYKVIINLLLRRNNK